jgi:hypothetical protein
MNMENPIIDVSGATNPGRAIRPHALTLGLFLLAVGSSLTFCPAPARGQAAAAPPADSSVAQTDVKLVIGGEGVKNNSVGALTVVGNSLEFTSGKKKKMDVEASSILDISTNEDSRQDITGAAHLATMAIPYGGGRVLALFSHHVDVLTVEFKDANGAFHGTVFVLAQGQAAPFKKQLLTLGAKATVPLAEPAPADKQEDKH